jgi:hypothetical protein
MVFVDGDDDAQRDLLDCPERVSGRDDGRNEEENGGGGSLSSYRLSVTFPFSTWHCQQSIDQNADRPNKILHKEFVSYSFWITSLATCLMALATNNISLLRQQIHNKPNPIQSILHHNHSFGSSVGFSSAISSTKDQHI